MIGKLAQVMQSLKEIPCSYRLKIRNQEAPEAWSKWLIIPSASYLETEQQGPYAINDIEYLEIDPVSGIAMGRLVAAVGQDNGDKIRRVLEKGSIPFTEVDRVIRVDSL